MNIFKGHLAKPMLGFVLLVVAAFAVAALIGFVGAASGFDLPIVELVAMSVTAVVLMAGALWIGAIWMRSVDEAAQEAHKSAWYWGGCAGLCIGGVGIVLANLPQSAEWRIPSLIPGRTDPVAYLASGATALGVLMVVGYLVVWAWWWLARR